MQTARVAVPALFAIAVVAAIVIVAPPSPTDAPAQPEATPYSADHGRIPAEREAPEPAPTF